MSKKFLLGFALISLGFCAGCSQPVAPPPDDPAMEDPTDESAYDIPAESVE